MSEQVNGQVTTLQRPTTNNREDWNAYWKQQGQPWRTEPEIDVERQKYLAERQNIKPDIKKGVYPFKDIKLHRADVEWLLATHENRGIQGPINLNDKSQWKRKGLDLRGANLCHEDLRYLPLTRLIGGLTVEEWKGATEEERDMAAVQLQEAKLWRAQLQKADFIGAQLQKADLTQAQLQEANLKEAVLQKADLREAHLQGVDLHRANLEDARLDDAILCNEKYGSVRLADIKWEEVNLAVIDWEHVIRLGDEQLAQLEKDSAGTIKDKRKRVHEYKEAVRAYRQLSVALRNQGLNEDAARFAYRAQLMQREVLRLGKKYWQYLFSLLLDLLAGYGYKPYRSFIAYLIVISAFAIAYYILGHTVGPALSPLGSIVFSMTSFHGRGFFPGGIGLDDPLTVVAALEAFVGLLIEVTFIATLTQRLFGK